MVDKTKNKSNVVKYAKDKIVSHYASIKHAVKTKLSKNKPLYVKEEENKQQDSQLDVASIKSEIEQKLKTGQKTDSKTSSKNYVVTYVPGFDALFEKGIPVGSSVLVAGGCGSGKTLFCLQTMYGHAIRGKKCLYMSFEESESNLYKHMADFGWDVEKTK